MFIHHLDNKLAIKFNIYPYIYYLSPAYRNSKHILYGYHKLNILAHPSYNITNLIHDIAFKTPLKINWPSWLTITQRWGTSFSLNSWIHTNFKIDLRRNPLKWSVVNQEIIVIMDKICNGMKSCHVFSYLFIEYNYSVKYMNIVRI